MDHNLWYDNIDVGDGYWRQFVLMTSLRCWWPFFLNRENTVTDIKLSPMIPYRKDRLGPTLSENKPFRPGSRILLSENNSYFFAFNEIFLLVEIAWGSFSYRWTCNWVSNRLNIRSRIWEIPKRSNVSLECQCDLSAKFWILKCCFSRKRNQANNRSKKKRKWNCQKGLYVSI